MAVSRKKIILSIVIVFLVLVGGVAGVLYQRLSDLDEIRNIIVEKLREATGREVHVGRAELDFEKGIGLRLREVSIGGQFRGQPRLGAESLWVVVKVLPLLRKQVEIRKLVLQGAQVQVIRDAAGQWNIHGLMDRLDQWAPPRGDGLLNVFKVSLIKRVVVQGGRVQLFDFHAGSEAEPVELNFESLNLSLRKDFFTPSYKFDLQAKVPHPTHPGAVQVAGKLLNVLSLSQGMGFAWEGRVSVEGLGLSGFNAYVREWVPEVPEGAHLGLAAKFSGEWGGATRSAGTVKYSSRAERREASLRDPAVPRQGVLDYDVSVGGEGVDVKAFRLQSGPFEASGSGRLSAIGSDNPKVSFAIATLPFEVSKSRHFFPLNVLFADAIHDSVQERLKAGKLEIQSLRFDGAMEELRNLNDPENHRRLFARVRLEAMDFASPLPPLKSVSGTIQLEKGIHTLDLARVVYADFAFTGIRGTLRDALDNPVADLSLENPVDAGKLHTALLKMFADDPFKKYIEDYQDLEGPARLRLQLKGPLKKPDEIFLEAGLRFEDVALREKGFSPRIEHLKGTIFCTRSPASDKTPPPLLRFVDLSGNFGGSSFSRLNGEVKVAGDATERTLAAFYRLGPGELPEVVEDLSLDPPFDEWGRKMVFSRGIVEVDYHSSGNPDRPDLEKEWGTILLRDLSMHDQNKAAAFHNLTGSVEFESEGLKLKEVLGWFGDSPFHLEGTVFTPAGAPPEFSLHLLTNSLKSSDLASIPLLENLRFEGLAEVDLRVSGTERSFTFQNHLDLTRTTYRFGDRFTKKKGASHQMKMDGEYSVEQGVKFSSLDIDLDYNRISGHGQINNMDDPFFTVQLAAKEFKLHPAAQFFSLLQDCRGGAMSFEVQGSGNLNRMEEASWDGVMKVANMKLRPAHFLNTLAIDTQINISGRKFEVREGTLKSDRSNVRFIGKGKLGSTLDLDLKLTGDRLVVDELLPEPEDQAVDFKTYMSDSPFFSRGTGRVQFSLQRLNFKFLDLVNASGLLTLEDEKLKVNTLDIGKDKEVMVRGVVSLDNSEEGTLRGLIRAKNTRAENFMALFGGLFDGTLTGNLKKLDLRFQSNGKGMPTLEKTLEARWVFDVSNGMIDTDGLRSGVIQLFGLKNSAASGAGPSSQKSRLKPFAQIAGKFELSKGIADTEKFIHENDERRTSIVGKFDLVRHEMDLIAGVAPMPKLDKFLTKIPVVGKIITGGDEESLMKAYFSVQGSFDDPKVSAVPLTSISRKVLGIFQGIFQSPGSLIPDTREAEQ